MPMQHTQGSVPPQFVPPVYGSNRPGIPDTPEARAHAKETEELRIELSRRGLTVEQIKPTSDGRGHVRLNFDQLRALLMLDQDDRD